MYMYIYIYIYIYHIRGWGVLCAVRVCVCVRAQSHCLLKSRIESVFTLFRFPFGPAGFPFLPRSQTSKTK